MESETKRVHMSTCEERKLISDALHRCEYFTNAVCRFTHPCDSNLSITWRETGYSDKGDIILEYENDVNNDLLQSFLEIFPMYMWTFKKSLKKPNVFNQKTRSKVYTLHPRNTITMQSLLSYNNNNSITQSEVTQYQENIKEIKESFLTFLMQIALDPRNKWARKWDGYQHVVSFEKDCTLHILPSNAHNGFTCKLTNKYNEAITNIYWLCEILNDKLIFVDACLPDMPFRDRRKLLNTYLNESLLTEISKQLKLNCELQQWFTFDEYASTNQTDGILIHIDNEDRIYKLKSSITVDLCVSNNGSLHTENNVIIAKCNEKQWFGKIVEFKLKHSISLKFLQKPFTLEYQRFRDDRVTANTFLEFCEAAKASIVTDISEKLISALSK